MHGAMTLGKGRVIRRARQVHERGVTSKTFADYGLQLTDADEANLGQQIDPIEEDQIVGWVKGWRSTHFLIGFCGASSEVGHATGLIKLKPDGTDYRCFDPNQDMYEFASDPQTLWLRLAIVKAPLAGYTSIQVWGCKPMTTEAALSHLSRT